MGVEQKHGPIGPEKIPGVEVVLDPRELTRGNLAARVVNLNSILEGGVFDPDWYATQRAEVVQVGRPGNYRLRDGHHRTAAAADYKDEHPEYEFVCNDVTGFVTAKKYPGQKFLTTDQWVLEVSDPSRIHAEHRFRRVAAVMWTEWNREMGDDAHEYTALTALHILGKPQFMMRSLNMDNIARALRNPENPLFGGVTSPEKRKRFADGLTSMAELVISTKFGYDELAWGSQEVATGFYEDIGKDEREGQISGLVMLPHIHAKIFAATEGSYADRKRRVADALITRYQVDPDASPDDIRDRLLKIRRLLTPQTGNYEDLLADLEGRKRASRLTTVPSTPVTPRGRSPRSYPVSREPLRPMDPESNAQRHALSLIAALHLIDPATATPATRRAMVEAHQALQAFLVGRKSGEPPVASRVEPASGLSTWSGEFGVMISGSPETVQLLERLHRETKKADDAAKRGEGDPVPDFALRYPRELFVSRWAAHAACRDDPDAMDVDGAEQNEAKKNCAGCPVRMSCLADELPHTRDEQAFVRGGMTARERHDMLDHDVPQVHTIVREVAKARTLHDALVTRIQRQGGGGPMRR